MKSLTVITLSRILDTILKSTIIGELYEGLPGLFKTTPLACFREGGS